jgi:hypothetical protein
MRKETLQTRTPLTFGNGAEWAAVDILGVRLLKAAKFTFTLHGGKNE